MQFNGNQNFNNNQVLNLAVHSGTSFPSSPSTGQLFFNTTEQTLYVRRQFEWTKFAIGSNSQIPQYTMVFWSGNYNTIPEGFVICDGNNGSPNASGRFIKACAAGASLAGTLGGGAHTHTFANHTHSVGGATGPASPAPGATAHSTEGEENGRRPVPTSHQHSVQGNVDSASGTTGSGYGVPPYKELILIMKT